MSQHVGRHRSQSFSAFGELADLAARTARPAAKASAVAVASGGIVASFAVPASANPLAAGSKTASAAVAPQPAVAAPVAQAPAVKAPAVKAPASAALMALAAPQTAPAAARPLIAAAVAAPAKKGDVNPVDTLGVLGFTAKKAARSATISVERIAPVVTETATTTATAGTASRGATRTATTTTTTAQAPAPEINIPAPTAGIAAIAASLLGIPYVYGGTSTSGFDCSGYTQYVYRMAGKSIPRTAEAQRAASIKVSNPVPGDLVFFGYPAFHAAIYAGPGKIYHASRPGTVTSLANFLSYGTVTYGRF